MLIENNISLASPEVFIVFIADEDLPEETFNC